MSDARRGRRLVAAVELISPANKDRPEHRSQFTSKCAALLRQGVSLVLVDVVTAGRQSVCGLLQMIGRSDGSLGAAPPQSMPWPAAGGPMARAAGWRLGP